ncbi:MAG: DinB family protein [Bacteroidales bacterium]
MDWNREVQRAGDDVEAWIARVRTGGWTEPVGSAWSNKDLLGHLAAWSNLLTDQVEAFIRESPCSTAAVDVDAWNAEQVALRRARAPGEIVQEWRSSFRRAVAAAEALPRDVRGRTVSVAWATDPVSAEDLLQLWVLHVRQHRARFAEQP